MKTGAAPTGCTSTARHISDRTAGTTKETNGSTRRTSFFSSRQANIISIIDRTGTIVWKMGPDYRDVPALAELGQIVGQHHPHLIPEGLPGAGNLLVFDNGGSAGYGAPSPTAPTGRSSASRFLVSRP